MRERWPRFRREIELGNDVVAHLVGRVLPGHRVIGQTPVSGGRVNTNVRVTLADAPGSVLLRIYQRDPGQGAKEARLDSVLRAGGVRTARFFGLVEADDQTGLTYAVLEWVDGVRLDVCAPGSHDAALGRSVGETLAKVHRIDVGPAGFLTPDSRPPAAIRLGPAAMAEYVRSCIVAGPGAARLGPELTDRLMTFVAQEAGQLIAWASGPGLVHGDCNPSNFVIAGGAVAALLDWEFAFSGAPAFDFGTLLRPPLGCSEAFATALGEGYRSAGGVLHRDWRRLARITDLYGWADFLGRENIAREIVEDAKQMVADTLNYFAVAGNQLA